MRPKKGRVKNLHAKLCSLGEKLSDIFDGIFSFAELEPRSDPPDSLEPIDNPLKTSEEFIKAVPDRSFVIYDFSASVLIYARCFRS